MSERILTQSQRTVLCCVLTVPPVSDAPFVMGSVCVSIALFHLSTSGLELMPPTQLMPSRTIPAAASGALGVKVMSAVSPSL